MAHNTCKCDTCILGRKFVKLAKKYHMTKDDKLFLYDEVFGLIEELLYKLNVSDIEKEKLSEKG